jgi:hypothetical protein
LDVGAFDQDFIPVYIKGKEGANQEKNQTMPVQKKVLTTDKEDEERSFSLSGDARQPAGGCTDKQKYSALK